MADVVVVVCQGCDLPSAWRIEGMSTVPIGAEQAGWYFTTDTGWLCPACAPRTRCCQEPPVSARFALLWCLMVAVQLAAVVVAVTVEPVAGLIAGGIGFGYFVGLAEPSPNASEALK
jgi:hypothetical protein